MSVLCGGKMSLKSLSVYCFCFCGCHVYSVWEVCPYSITEAWRIVSRYRMQENFSSRTGAQIQCPRSLSLGALLIIFSHETPANKEPHDLISDLGLKLRHPDVSICCSCFTSCCTNGRFWFTPTNMLFFKQELVLASAYPTDITTLLGW